MESGHSECLGDRQEIFLATELAFLASQDVPWLKDPLFVRRRCLRDHIAKLGHPHGFDRPPHVYALIEDPNVDRRYAPIGHAV